MYKVNINENTYQVDLINGITQVDEEQVLLDIEKVGENSYHILSDHQSYFLQVLSLDPDKKLINVKINGSTISLSLQDRYDLLLAKLGMDKTTSTEANELSAPMPGLILEIRVKEGDEVSKGDPVVVLEAMKMENVIKSPGSGTVMAIAVKTGDNVEKNQVLIRF